MRKFMVTVNGNRYEVDVEEIGESNKQNTSTRKERVEKIADPVVKKVIKSEPSKNETPKKQVVASAGEELITSPMPGTILKVNVGEGDSVSEGDTIMILEAMKMENEIVAPKTGRLKVLAVGEGASVNTGDQLAVIE